MKNKQALVDHLKQISHLFGKAKDQWRSRAYSKAAGEIEALPGNLVFENGRLMNQIEGVGKSLKETIEQFAATGNSEKMKMLREKLPNEVVDRFSAAVCKRKVKMILQPLTDAGIDWGFAGSMRRKSKTVRDVDVIVCLRKKAERKIVESALERAGLKADVRNGDEKIGVSVPIKKQGRAFTLDLVFTKPATRGSMYLYFTGPKANAIALRRLAKEMGMRLNQNGLFKNGKCIASRTEEEILAKLGVEYVAPEERS